MHKLYIPVSQVPFSFNNQLQFFLKDGNAIFQYVIITTLFIVVYFFIFSQAWFFEIHIES